MIYFDNSSTTKPCKKAVENINKALSVNWGNPSSLHNLGVEAEIIVTQTREKIAKALNCRSDEIFFTGSGTEANNTAIMSFAGKKHAGKRIITTAIEHPSVLNTVKRLEKYGYEIVYLHPDKSGVISLCDLESALTDDTALVSIMLVNNEIGAIEPIKEAAKLTHEKAKNALFHCDAVQAFGKLPINIKDLGVDLLTVSGHKIHGPKGVGVLYAKKGINLLPLITGGGQEHGLRSGTESVPLIAGLLGAVEDLPDLNIQLQKQTDFVNYAKQKLIETGLVTINSDRNALPYILNISVKGYRSETLLHFLESKEIYVSSGSACAKGELSYVLSEIGLNKDLIDSNLRLSFNKDNNTQEVDLFVDALIEAAAKIRKANV